MITHEQIRERLIESIRQSGMTQTEIARVLRISQSAVSEYLKPVDLARPDDYPEDDEL